MKEFLWHLNMYFHFSMFQFKMGACFYIKKILHITIQIFDPNYKSELLCMWVGVNTITY
jgi:hypothetical protein